MTKIKKGKLRVKWEGPFVIEQEWGNGTFDIRSADGEEQQLVNGNKLKPYYMRENACLREMERIMFSDPETMGNSLSSNNQMDVEV